MGTFNESLFIQKPATMNKIRTRAEKHIDSADAAASRKVNDTRDSRNGNHKASGDQRVIRLASGQGPPGRYPTQRFTPLNIQNL